jgi:hypothetical protein
MLGLAAIPGAADRRHAHCPAHAPVADDDRPTRPTHGTLERLRSGDPDADVDAELDDIETANREEGGTKLRDLFGDRLRPLLFIGLRLAVFQQFVGINTVIYYAPTILADTGLTNSSSITYAVFVAITNVVFTIWAMLLLDKVGRRTLLLTGIAGLFTALLILAAYFWSPTLQQNALYLALGVLLLHVASFAIGLGPVL